MNPLNSNYCQRYTLCTHCFPGKTFHRLTVLQQIDKQLTVQSSTAQSTWRSRTCLRVVERKRKRKSRLLSLSFSLERRGSLWGTGVRIILSRRDTSVAQRCMSVDPGATLMKIKMPRKCQQELSILSFI